MRSALVAVSVLVLLGGPLSGDAGAAQLSGKRVKNGIAGAWTGAVIAGAWGFPTEFVFNGRTVPKRAVPPYNIDQVNHYAFGGESDETYVEIPFLHAMARHGPTASWSRWTPPFARSRFLLFGANKRARKNLRRGIAAPASGNPDHNPFFNDIDFQIESDFIGLAAPGQPGVAADIAWRLGHVMNYGDGVYGGVMVSAMHAAAFKAKNIAEIVAAGQAAVPEGTAYRRMIDDVLRWHARHPAHWKPTWRRLERRWNARTRPSKTHHLKTQFNIDAKLNGGYVLMGLLYGHGNFVRTVRITMRAGQDSDCNPSNAASILGTWLGRKGIPDRFKNGISRRGRFTGTKYTLPRAIRTNRAIARSVLAYRGGRIAGGRWLIPPSPGGPVGFEQRPFVADGAPQIGGVNASVDGRTASLSVAADDPEGVADVWWSFGDLSGAHGAAVQHTYAQPGSYPVTVWVADALGRTSATQITVDVS